jgi:hypothetical protein
MLNGILEIVKSFQQPTKPENVPRRKTATQRRERGEQRPGAQRGDAPVSPGIAHRAHNAAIAAGKRQLHTAKPD